MGEATLSRGLLQGRDVFLVLAHTSRLAQQSNHPHPDTDTGHTLTMVTLYFHLNVCGLRALK